MNENSSLNQALRHNGFKHFLNKVCVVLYVFVSFWSVSTFAKGNLQKGNRYLYCHMNDTGPAWTAYALSKDGIHWYDNGKKR